MRLRPLGSRTVAWGLALAGGPTVAIVLITWRGTSPVLSLLYPLLLLGVLALGVLWALRHF
jgi:hypothetical protein